MRKFIFLTAFIISVCVACKNKGLDKQAYEQTKQTLGDKEKNNPLDFLAVTAHDKRSFFGIGRQTIVKGLVINNATICSYKDVRIKMLCFNKTGTRMEEHEDILDDVVAPGASADYRMHYKLPKETDSIAVSIMSATGILPDTTKAAH